MLGIRIVSVEELYNHPGFEDMVAEYAQMAIEGLPKPSYLKDDYLPLEKAGVLKVWAAIAEGNVVGFMSVINTTLPKYNARIVILESYFVMQDYRKHGVGLKFLSIAEKYGIEELVSGIFVNTPYISDLEKILTRKNYAPATKSFFKAFQ